MQIFLAAYYMNKIDYSVNPCDNFFDFACGRWNKESRVPTSKSSYLTYSVIRDRVNKEVAGEVDLYKVNYCSLPSYLSGDSS